MAMNGTPSPGGKSKTGFLKSNMSPGKSTSGVRSTVSSPGKAAMKTSPNTNTSSKGPKK